MAGYNSYSMSNNAVDAYASGEMPLSKWTKSAILDQIKDYLNSIGNAEHYAKFQSMSKSELGRLLINSSWHHTSKFYNKTVFYSLDEEAVDATCEAGEEKNFVLMCDGKYKSLTRNADWLYFTDDINNAVRVSEYAGNAHINKSAKYKTVWTKIRVDG